MNNLIGKNLTAGYGGVDIIKDMIQEKMQNAYQLNVPLKVDVGEGYNWLEAH